MHTEDYCDHRKLSPIYICVLLIIARFILSYVFSFLPQRISDPFLSICLSTLLNSLSWLLPFGIAGSIFWRKYTKKSAIKTGFKDAFAIFFATVFSASFLSIPYTRLLLLFGYGIQGTDISQYNFLQLIVFVFSSVILVPVAEEFAFRKIILSNLLSLGRKPAIIISALLFALCHDPSSYVYSFVFGFVLAVTAINYGFELSLLFHAANNAISVTYILLERYLTETSYNIALLIRYALMLILGIYGIVSIYRSLRSKPGIRRADMKNR